VIAFQLTLPAAAGDQVGTAPTELVSDMPVDVGFGLAVTSNYLFRGITNSSNDPAIQGYIEPRIGPIYASVWSSNVDFGEGLDGAEIDVGVGIRPQIDQLSLDIGYVHYFYAPDDLTPDYGELFGKGEYKFDDVVTLGSQIYFAPDYSQTDNNATYVEGNVKIALPEKFLLSGGIGYQFFEDPETPEQLVWNVGLSYAWDNGVKIDLRYWDTDLSQDECVFRSGFADGCDARVVATLSFETAWSALKGH
jgi:uncharacterized protein (TIGR02001 family)